MISSRLRKATRGKARKGHSPDSETIHEFLGRELPPGKAKHARYFAEALDRAAARYDRYSTATNRREWLNYSHRGSRLERIVSGSKALASDLCALDVITRDDLAARINPPQFDALIGSLRLLAKQAAILGMEVQRSGRPRDLAEERWIMDLADIYENAFSQSPRVWKSDDGSLSRFFRFLELGRPETFPKHGKLSRRQVARTLRHGASLLGWAKVYQSVAR